MQWVADNGPCFSHRVFTPSYFFGLIACGKAGSACTFFHATFVPAGRHLSVAFAASHESWSGGERSYVDLFEGAPRAEIALRSTEGRGGRPHTGAARLTC